MLSVTFRCPRCEATAKAILAADMTALTCPQCGATAELPEGAGREVRRCLVCPSRDLFVRKDFPQRLGIAIVCVGFAGFLIANYYYMKYLAFGFLFATALIDVLLYFLVGEALVCYRCGAHYRGVEDLGDHTSFELETHERYRQLAARMGEATKHGEGHKSSMRDPQH